MTDVVPAPAPVLPSPIGIESNLLRYLPQQGLIRARYRLIQGEGAPPLPPGAWVHVRINARVYSPGRVVNALPDTPDAEGVEQPATARVEYQVADLPLPPMPYGRYVVVASVYPADDERYPSQVFRPSTCWAGEATFGFNVHMRRADVEAVLAGIGNPLAQAEVLSLIQSSRVIAEDDDGSRYHVRFNQGQVTFDSIP